MERSLDGQVCMVTGATSGIGKATAAGLAQRGATVVLVGRNAAKGETVRDAIRAASGNERVELLLADLSSQQAIRELAATVNARYSQLHVLVNNVGGIFFRRETTVDGLELTFALDHLAYFQLTALLLDQLLAGAPARIVNLSSSAATAGRVDFNDLQATQRYRPFGVYAQAKLANLLFTFGLARRLHGSGVTVNAVCPGPVATNFGGSGNSLLNRLFPRLFALIGKPPEYAAATVIQLATDPTLAGISGKAFYRGKEYQTSARAQDVAAQQRLWEVSARLTGVDVQPGRPGVSALSRA